MTVFTNAEREQIAAAIVRAESRTSGEIVVVVATESDTYLYVPFMWAALVAMLVPWPFVYLTWWPIQSIYILQLAVFALLVAVLWWRPVRFALVPRSVRDLRAHRRAMEQFLVQDLSTTAGRTGILIFVSLAERYAEVVADAGIHAKVPAGTWQQIVDELTGKFAENKPAEAFVRAIEAVGGHLAAHFPPGSRDPNELPNHLIVLS